MCRMALSFRTFAEVHADARKAAGLTQEEAARKVGVSLRTVQHWEAGTKEPRWPQLLRCAQVYGTGFLAHIERPTLREMLLLEAA